MSEAVEYKLLIADDHPLFRGALREGISGLMDRAEIAEAGTFDEAVAILDRSADIDLVLLDLAMPVARGFSGLMYLRTQYPSVPVVVVSANDDPATIRRCMEFGASGFIPKTLGVEDMRAAISRILGGGLWTPPDVDLSAGSDAETAALMARMAADARSEAGGDATAAPEFSADDVQRLLAPTEHFLAAEREDRRRLRDLSRALRPLRNEHLWPLIVELMEIDTRKHVRILEYLRGGLRSARSAHK